MRLIQASATQIPLADALCDYVACVDTLEHLPPSQRDSAIREALRVTRHQYFITVPSGRAAAQLEKFFYLMLAPVYRLFHKDLSFLGMHLQNGLPTKESICGSIADDRSGETVEVRGNINLGIHLLLPLYLAWDIPLTSATFRRKENVSTAAEALKLRGLASRFMM